MERNKNLYTLSEAILSLIKLNDLLRDKFFYEKFQKKIHEVVLDYLELIGENKKNNVQRQNYVERTLVDVDNILELVDYLRYLKLLTNTEYFLKAQKCLFELKLEILKERVTIPEPRIETVFESKQATTSVNRIVSNVAKKSNKLNQSKKSILEFIRSFPNSRTKDIITEFNALSDRTVKRNLTDLLRNGLVKKRVDNKAVYYYVE